MWAARQVFDRFPGKWEVNQHSKNDPSKQFWKRVIGDYKNGAFDTVSYIEDGVEYQSLLFENADREILRNVRLEEVTRENLLMICRLQVFPEQKWYVAPNSCSIAEAAYEPDRRLYGIYDGEQLIGFGMTARDALYGHTEVQEWIMRFMIDRRFQHRGLGREAFGLLLEKALEEAAGGAVYLSVEPENETARKLYRSFGFEDTDERCWGEIVMKKAKGQERRI